MQKKRVLVIGANGTLGQTFRHHYCGEMDIEFAVKQLIPKSSDIWFDIAEVDTEYAVEMLSQYDYIVNCAAVTNVDRIENEHEVANEAWKINAGCVKKLSEWCRKANTVLVHISTDFVFDGYTYRSYIEDDVTKPVNIYGTTKETGERFIRESGCRYYIIRTSWLYSEYGNNCFTRIMEDIVSGKTLQGTDDIISSPTYARDLVKFICDLIMKNPVYGIYHFTNEGVCTRYDFIKEIINELGNSFFVGVEPVRNDIFDCPAKRPFCTVLSKEKVRNIYGSILHWRESLLDCIVNYKMLKEEINKQEKFA